MKNFIFIAFLFTMIVSSLSADGMSCPDDSSYHVDMRTMLPDGTPNPTLGQVIYTGLCACVDFVDGVYVNGNEVTFIINLVDKEPIRGVELNLHTSIDELITGSSTNPSVVSGDKIDNLLNEDGTPTTMTALANWIDDYTKILIYSINRAKTYGDSLEGSLVEITYTLDDGAVLPDDISLYFSLVNIPGTTAGDPPGTELLNVACGFPSEDNPAVIDINSSLSSDDEGQMIPNAFALHQNYPNPFNPSTQISFDVPSSDFIILKIYNLLGQDIQTLMNKTLNPGTYTVEWNGDDLFKNEVASGVYFYELRGKSFVSRKKMLLIR